MKYSIPLCLIISAMLCGCSAGVQPGRQASVEQVGTYTVAECNLSDRKLGWGQGYNVNEKNQPISCIDYQNKYSKYGAVFIGKDEKNICLTFDEGYENGYTPMILDTLKEKKVNAVCRKQNQHRNSR